MMIRNIFKTTKVLIKNIIQKIFGMFGYRIVNNKFINYYFNININQDYQNEKSLPNGALEYLNNKNIFYQNLQKKYSRLDKTITEPLLWNNTYIESIDLPFFRKNNPYVRQLREPYSGILNYALTAYYIYKNDDLNLLSILKDDDLFGNNCIKISDKIVSRDLLDSINEIYFLEKHLKIITRSSKLTVLDIGAGYGRLAQRMIEASDQIDKYICTDAIPLSTFISDYYINYRGLQNRVKVIPLHEIVQVVSNTSIDLAINIHSFSECTLDAIEWWLKLLFREKITYLMIVPNGDINNGKSLLTIKNENFSGLVEKYGYELVTMEPKYNDPVVQKYGLYSTHYHLYKIKE